MPINAGKMRRVSDEIDRTTESIKEKSSQVKHLKDNDPKNFEQTSETARKWAENVPRLKSSLEDLGRLTKAMGEQTRIQDEQHGESSRDKYRFLLDRLKADVRFFFHALQDFIELEPDPTHQRNWASSTLDMETAMKSISAGAEDSVNDIEPIIMLLNYRDSVISLLLIGIMFQKAVLDFDIKSQRTYADAPMVEMAEKVVNIYSKSEMLPAKLRVSELPAMNSPGSFTYQKNSGDNNPQELTETPPLSPLQSRLLSLLREMQLLDKTLRRMTFGNQVNIPDKHRSAGKNIGSEDIRKEITRWFDKCSKLENELLKHKESRGTPWEVQLEQLTAKNTESQKMINSEKVRVNKLETEVKSLKYDLKELRKEKAELAEKNLKIQKETTPKLDDLEKKLGKSWEAVESLLADAQNLSSMFRIQVQENRKNIAERDDLSKKLAKTQKDLTASQEENLLKDEELHKKETLYLRTMAARKSIHEGYLEQKSKVNEAEEKMRQRDADWQQMLKVVEGRDLEIKQLQTDIQRASARIDELESQKKKCLQEFHTATGKPLNVLLLQFNKDGEGAA